MFTILRSKCRLLRIPLMAGFLLIAASLVLAPAAEARNARKAHAAQSTASRQILNVRSAVLMDARTGKILYSQNPDVRIPPASLTKIMSMMVTFDAIRSGKVKLSDQIRVSRHAARQGGSRMGLRAGERVSLNRLLMGMAVSSGNDASMAVAERVGGSGRAFVKMMNNKARQIGMSSSTFKTPNGLPGIPVTSGGNYTDSTGQQWVCDEIDLERGVKVQRMDKAAFDSTKTLAEQNAAILATPVETPLTPEEIAAYKSLTTYAPNTVVQASDGAGVRLEYQRDVNIAIKKLEDAIASMTTT